MRMHSSSSSSFQFIRGVRLVRGSSPDFSHLGSVSPVRILVTFQQGVTKIRDGTGQTREELKYMVAEKDIPNPDPNDRVRSGTGPDTHRTGYAPGSGSCSGSFVGVSQRRGAGGYLYHVLSLVTNMAARSDR